MKNFLKKLVATLGVLAVLGGCAFTPVPRTTDCVESRIYDAIDAIKLQPDVVGKFLLAADIVAIQEGLYTAKAALDGIAHIRGILNGAMYSEVFQIVAEHFKAVRESKAAGYISFILPVIPRLNIDKVVTKCDQGIILALLDEHESAIKRLMTSGK